MQNPNIVKMTAPLMYRGYLIKRENGILRPMDLSTGVCFEITFTNWEDCKEILDAVKGPKPKNQLQ